MLFLCLTVFIFNTCKFSSHWDILSIINWSILFGELTLQMKINSAYVLTVGDHYILLVIRAMLIHVQLNQITFNLLFC